MTSITNIFKKYFGKKIKDKKLDYIAARSLIKSLETQGATPLEIKIQHSTGGFAHKNIEFPYVYVTLDNFVAPYEYDFDDRLKGRSSVRYIVKEYANKQIHRFEFMLRIDNFHNKNIKSRTGILVLKSKKKI